MAELDQRYGQWAGMSCNRDQPRINPQRQVQQRLPMRLYQGNRALPGTRAPYMPANPRHPEWTPSPTWNRSYLAPRPQYWRFQGSDPQAQAQPFPGSQPPAQIQAASRATPNETRAPLTNAAEQTLLSLSWIARLGSRVM
ncbi:hypothetical protein N7462_003879 [Penicillium macrosclerotiorum]|uniref:uncharacterized protein n=1 Tax=Penicillium macrosclerotiorum TaxID=303699 RepID=UPI002547B939|nr:uncharacterized protein N7462_003879 [Penicillium macrosclerotiorum]KAJ5689487.1 hypothetical protein N7462_003879 [Penicillium macrosclerotiorum]